MQMPPHTMQASSRARQERIRWIEVLIARDASINSTAKAQRFIVIFLEAIFWSDIPLYLYYISPRRIPMFCYIPGRYVYAHGREYNTFMYT